MTDLDERLRRSLDRTPVPRDNILAEIEARLQQGGPLGEEPAPFT